MEFFKYEAAGNDFIMLDRFSGGNETTPDEARRLCARRTGVGADGVIEMLPSDSCDFKMRILNADGSEAQMCGNGARALFLFALDRGVLDSDEATVETLSGARRVSRAKTQHRGQAPVLRFSVDMGVPKYRRADIPMEGQPTEEAVSIELPLESRDPVTVTCVSMGNPHCVVFVQDVNGYPVQNVGPLLETHRFFPERTNVEFVEILDDGNLEARVWERGVGETLACGTGACASVVAASVNGLIPKRASVFLPGGALVVDWTEDGVLLTGPARHVFDGKTVH